MITTSVGAIGAPTPDLPKVKATSYALTEWIYIRRRTKTTVTDSRGRVFTSDGRFHYEHHSEQPSTIHIYSIEAMDIELLPMGDQ